ncbi:hypothetical protein LXL04_004385 [Taraxacum kok-saghyz]
MPPSNPLSLSLLLFKFKTIRSTNSLKTHRKTRRNLATHVGREAGTGQGSNRKAEIDSATAPIQDPLLHLQSPALHLRFNYDSSPIQYREFIFICFNSSRTDN